MSTRTFPASELPDMRGTMRQRVRDTLDQLKGELLDQRTAGGYWIGELSPSALSTATAISAMSAVLRDKGREVSPGDRQLVECIAQGIGYLRHQQNGDGGFGDTDRSHSNIATSYLVLAASRLADLAIGQPLPRGQLDRLNRYITGAGSISGLRRRYGKDKTFVVPILTNLAIAGVVPWDDVPPLPFEAAVFPQSMYRLLQMPVVSYAIPALVAIGQARHFHGHRVAAPLRLIRAASVGRTMKALRSMQPDSGGYLEATPLTSFVVMSLAATGRSSHEVSKAGLRFLVESKTSEGSWPIDTNLATWVTSLAIHALATDPDDDGNWCSEDLVNWHLGCQHTARHPFTGAEPGGWGWSDLSGAVPDSDDTPAAILALGQARRWVNRELSERCAGAIGLGSDWLRRLQNVDGGWPTFCRGWGKLPFDRSSNDLTGHAIRALTATPDRAESRDRHKLAKAAAFLAGNQQPDGSWLPLWFGNQDRDDESNPVYGTSRVLLAGASGILPTGAVERGCRYLVEAQNSDGGWGGGRSVSAWLQSVGKPDGDTISSVEESALAVDALATVSLWKRIERESRDIRAPRNLGSDSGVESGQVGQTPDASSPMASGGNDAQAEAIIRGIDFLLRRVERGCHRVPWPIGFYFAKLWYHERLYPLIFTITALGKYLHASGKEIDADWPR